MLIGYLKALGKMKWTKKMKFKKGQKIRNKISKRIGIFYRYLYINCFLKEKKIKLRRNGIYIIGYENDYEKEEELQKLKEKEK